MTEIGESVNVAIIKDETEKYLNAKIIEVSFEGGYKTCREKTTVNAPHWPAAEDGANQSEKPAVFPFGHKGTQKAKVKVKIDSKGLSGNGKLRGTLKTLEFEGDVPLASGEHTVETTLKEPPEGVSWIKGEMSWGVEGGERSVLAGATLSELFFVFDDPGKMKFFSKAGVWVEALRFLIKHSRVAGNAKDAKAIEEVTRCCFSIKWHEYDIEEGAPKYGGASDSFQLTDYMEVATTKPVNCYDQAYAVVVFSGAVGLRVDGLFLRPFGFLKYTNLVGWGPCNNPFPNRKLNREKLKIAMAPMDANKKSTLLAALEAEDYLVVDPKDPDRSAFANHMFCEYSAKIYDACAGPVVGSGDKSNYVDEVIDKVMPSGYDSSTMGTAAAIIRIGPAITKVE